MSASRLILFLLATFGIATTLVSAHMAIGFPAPRGGFGTKDYRGDIHTFIGYEGKKYPCGGYPLGPVTEMKAGEVINVRFWGPKLRDLSKLPPKNKFLNQARHGGGTCQFSLSYDGGETFHLIGEYTKTCPDFYFEWPVKLPALAPSCEERGKCIFAWSWTGHLVPQFYHNCVDVKIKGVDKDLAKLPKREPEITNIPKFPKGSRPGDGRSHEISSGPSKDEINNNLFGKWE